MLRHICLSTGLLALASLHGAYAADTSTLEETVVTAQRLPETYEDSLASISIITREDIETSSAQTLSELISQTTAVQSSQNGGPGTVSSLYLRGTNSNQYVLLVDGVRVSDAFFGSPNLGQISLDLIEKIEIVRGPRSGVYGADAIGGVIQVFTKAKKNSTTASVSIGSENTYKSHAAVSQSFGDNTLSASISTHNVDDGINAYKLDTSDSTDGYQKAEGRLGLDVKATENVRFGANWWRAHDVVEYDDTFSFADGAGADFNEDTFSGFTTIDVNDDLRFNIRGSLQQHQYIDNQFGESGSSEHHYSINAEWYASDNISTVIGIERKLEKVYAGFTGAFDRRSTDSFFASSIIDTNLLQTGVALRYDQSSQYGEVVTGNIDINVPLSDAWTLHSSIGNGFNAPDFASLFYPGFSNPDLLPEESKSAEIGVRFARDNFRSSFNLYHTTVDDLIVFIDNVNSATISGAELELAGDIDKLKWQFNYAFTDAKDDTTDLQLLRRAKHSANATLSYRLKNFQPFMNVSFQSERPDQVAGVREDLDSYTLLNLGLHQTLNDHFSISYKVNNVTDEDYETVRYYSQPGINGLITLRYQR